MKVNIFKRRAILLTKKGVRFQSSYYLPDMSYGKFLIYNQFKPVYYIDLFDSGCKGIKEHIEANKIDAESLLTHLLALKGLKDLSLKEQCLWKFRFGKETSVQYELDIYETNY